MLETLAARAQADDDDGGRGWNIMSLGLDVVDGIEYPAHYGYNV